MFSLVLFSVIVSTLMAFIKFDERKAIFRYAAKMFLYFIGSVILLSWVMNFV
jgi:hypothetical protein